MRRFKYVLSGAGLMVASMVFAADDLVLQAKQHLDSGDAQAAYELLVPLQSDRAGDPEYDFVLGSAALQLGRNTEAVFALERVLAVKPDATPARALIARAYFNLKETETAKREFESVRKQQDVPDDVALTIDRFLDAISRIEEEQGFVIGGFFEFGSGRDSNVNSATSTEQVAIPAFGGLNFSLSSASQELSDSYVHYAVGINVRGAITRQASVFGGASYARKVNSNEHDFSTRTYDVQLGFDYRRNRDAIALVAQSGGFYLDDPTYDHAFRRANGATIQWQHDFNARNQASAFVQYSQLIYPQQRVRDADRAVGGLGFAHAFGKTSALVSYFGLYGGNEKESDESFPQFGHDLYGLEFGAQQFLSEKSSIFVNASAEQREYHGQDPFFLVAREDTQYSGSAGLHFVPQKHFRFTPQVSWIQNDSNILINEYDRWTASVSIRYEF